MEEKNRVLKVVGMEMGKMGEKESLKRKNKGRFGVKVKKVSEKEIHSMDFGEELKVSSEAVMEVLEREWLSLIHI